MTITVTTQAELDAALTDHLGQRVVIDSPAGEWLTVGGSASVEAWGSASVEAWGSASVVASGSASVVASGSASVEAWGSASVEASGSASVEASGSATVTAGSHVAVHLHSDAATVHGGVLIDHTNLDLTDVHTWAAYRGAAVADGRLTVYKAVDADLRAGHGWTLTAYPPGGTVTAPDWNPAAKCGGGLHFSPHPLEARRYYTGRGQPRFLEVTVAVEDVVCLDDKIKARECVVVREVDVHRRPIGPDATAVKA